MIFDCGIAGAAWATLAAQIASAVLIIVKILTVEGEWHFIPQKELINIAYLKELMTKGIPAGLQAVFMSISSLVIQNLVILIFIYFTYINTVYCPLEGKLFAPI